MINTNTPTVAVKADKATCSHVGKKNAWGKPKLFAKLTPLGIEAWCIYCECAHLIPAQDCMNFWQSGEVAGDVCQP